MSVGDFSTPMHGCHEKMDELWKCTKLENSKTQLSHILIGYNGPGKETEPVEK